MFSDEFQELLDFFSDTSVTQNDKISSNPFSSLFPTTELAECYAQSHKCPPIQESEEEKEKLQEYIRRVRVNRVNKKKSSPVMMGRMMGKKTNKKEMFVADTGTSVMILPVNIAKRNGVVWVPTDPDEPEYVGVTGVQVDIIG